LVAWIAVGLAAGALAVGFRSAPHAAYELLLRSAASRSAEDDIRVLIAAGTAAGLAAT